MNIKLDIKTEFYGTVTVEFDAVPDEHIFEALEINDIDVECFEQSFIDTVQELAPQAYTEEKLAMAESYADSRYEEMKLEG